MVVVKINGIKIEDKKEEKIQNIMKETNRETKRKKPVRKLFKVAGAITALLSIPTTASASGFGHPNIFSLVPQDFIKSGVERGEVGLWGMNEYMKDTLLNTVNLFNSPEIQTLFHSIMGICMSFNMIIIAKHGFDMIKARALGTNTIGAVELIVRLIASMLMSFVSLGILGWGIELSNTLVQVLFSEVAKGIYMPHSTSAIATMFWVVGYSIMFVILGIQYWIRQLTILILGITLPVANTTWVVDGGNMLKSLIGEFITLLSTPIAHALILNIGSIVTTSVYVGTGGFAGMMNGILIGFSTMFLMVFTPSFIRKFTTGTANPVKAMTGIFRGAVGGVKGFTSVFK